MDLPLTGEDLLPISNVDLTGRQKGAEPVMTGRYVRLQFLGSTTGQAELNPIVGFVMNHEIEGHASASPDDGYVIKEGERYEIIEVEVDPNWVVSHDWMVKHVGLDVGSAAMLKLYKATEDPWGPQGVWRIAMPEASLWFTAWPSDTDIEVSVIGARRDERRDFLVALLAKLEISPSIPIEELLDL
jgi:hypothetical protein